MVYEKVVGRALWRASEDADFRQRLIRDLGGTLAAEGFLMTDAEMATMRAYWEALHGLSERAASDKIRAWARQYQI